MGRGPRTGWPWRARAAPTTGAPPPSEVLDGRRWTLGPQPLLDARVPTGGRAPREGAVQSVLPVASGRRGREIDLVEGRLDPRHVQTGGAVPAGRQVGAADGPVLDR